MSRPSSSINTSVTGLHTRRIYTIAAAITFTLLLIGVAFIAYSSELNRQNTNKQIQQAAQVTRWDVEEYLYNQFNALQAAAILPPERELLSDDAAFAQLVKRLTIHNSFAQIGLVDLDGNALITDSSGTSRINLSDEENLKIVYSGRSVVTDPLKEDRFHKVANYYIVPVYDQATGMLEGALFAADPQDTLRSIINQSLYAEIGFIHIVDSEGNFILESDHPLSLTRGTNVFTDAPPTNEGHRDFLIESFDERKSGQVDMNIGGLDRVITYEPLSVNDWIVLYSIPAEEISPELRTTTAGTVIIIIVTALVIVFFIFLVRTVNNRNRSALEKLALEDPVTGRSNYQKFLVDAENILKRVDTSEYGICYCDIKDFKYINELSGREVSDKLLKYFSDALEKTIHKDEAFARVFADTFVILFKNGKNTRSGVSRFESIAQILEIFPDTFYHGYKIELYGGMYLLGSDYHETPHTPFSFGDNGSNNKDSAGDNTPERITLIDMIDRANTALKSIRDSGNVRLGFYSEEMHQQKLWETEIATKMELALEQGEFTFFLQPKINILEGNRVAGAEALVRWNSPDHGLLPPAKFIDFFERNGFIIKLDRYIFEQACKFYKETVLDTGKPRYVMSVNVSRMGLRQPDFIARYAEIKNRFKIPDGCIELEFTESLVAENLEQFMDLVAMCKGIGFMCSLDDFGSGYSSLNVLKNLDVDVLKLDRLFFVTTGNLRRGRVLVENVINLAKSLDMKTVAEGVDQAWQVDELRTMGCDMIQGYIFAKPMPPEEFLRFLDDPPI